MNLRIAAALALTAASSLEAQTAPPTIDYSTATPAGGNWSYAPVAGGSYATFTSYAAQPQLTITLHASDPPGYAIASRRPAPLRSLASGRAAETRNLPASFNPATGMVSASLPAFDPFLDAIAFSRGRVEFSVSGPAALVLPSWAEAARVIEDCRV